MNEVVYYSFFLLTFISGSVLAFYIRSSYSLRGKEEIAKAIFLTGLWGLNSFIQIATPSDRFFTQILFSTGVLCVLTISYYWYRFGCIYTDSSLTSVTKENKYSLTLIFALFVICLTNPFHSLVWSSFSFNAQKGVFDVTKTVFYTGIVTIAYIWYLTGIYYVSSFTYYAKNFFSTSLIILSIIPIVVGNAIPYIVPISVENTLTFIPVGGFISLAMSFVAIQKLSVGPIAREKIFEEISLPIFVQNRDGNVVDYNKKFYQLFADESSLNSVDKFASKIKSQLKLDRDEETDPVLFEYKEKYYNLTATPLELNNRLQGYVILLHDVTQIEEQKKELERTNYHLRKFSDSVAHEIRNPLTVIEGYAEQIERNTQNDKIKKMASKIQSQSDHIIAVIQDFQKAMEIAQTIEGEEYVDIEETIQMVTQVQRYPHLNSVIVSPSGEIYAEKERFSQIFEIIFRFLEANSENFDYTVTVLAHENGFSITTSGQNFNEKLTEGLLQHGYAHQHQDNGLSLSLLNILAEVHNWEVKIKNKKGNIIFEFTNADVNIKN